MQRDGGESSEAETVAQESPVVAGPVERLRPLNALSQIFILSATALMMLSFGGVYLWAQAVGLAVSLFSTIALLVAIRSGPWRFSALACFPAAAFIGYALLQTIRLPVGVLKSIAPWNAQIWTSLVDGDLPSASVSIYPSGALRDLTVVLVATAVFFYVVATCRTPANARRWLWGLVSIGAIAVAIALVQDIAAAKEIYFKFESPYGIANAGPFVNHNNFCQFVSPTIGAAVGLVFLLIHQSSTRGRVHSRGPSLSAPFDDQRRWQLAALTVFIVAAISSVGFSLSRGGFTGLVAAFAVTAAASALTRLFSRQTLILIISILAIFILFVCFGLDTVFHRLATLRDFSESYVDRWQILRDAWNGSRHFRLFGAGLGSFQHVFPMFDHSSEPTFAAHADNDYMQLVFETGIIGGFIVLAFLALICWHYLRCLRSNSRQVKCIALGCGFGLTCIVVQAWSDFGQHLMPNAIVSSILCGVLVGISSSDPSTVTVRDTTPRRAVALFLIPLAILLAWTTVWMVGGIAAESEWTTAESFADQLERNDWNGTEDEFAGLVSAAQNAATRNPENIDYVYWSNLYRSQQLSRITDETGEIKKTTELVEAANSIVRNLQAAKSICPTYAHLYHLTADIQQAILDLPAEALANVRQAQALSPASQDIQLLAGKLYASAGQTTESLAAFAKYLSLRGDFADILDTYVDDLHRPELAKSLAGNDWQRLSALAIRLRGNSGFEKLGAAVERDWKAAVSEAARAPDAPEATIVEAAKVAVSESRFADAVVLFERAVALDYGNAGLHLDLGKALAGDQRYSDAAREARLALRLRPDLTEARDLIVKVAGKSGANN